MADSSSTIARGSGHSLGSNRQSPNWLQWKKSHTITESGSSRRWYSRATSSSSSCVRYRSFDCQNPAAHSGSTGACPVTSA